MYPEKTKIGNSTKEDAKNRIMSVRWGYCGDGMTEEFLLALKEELKEFQDSVDWDIDYGERHGFEVPIKDKSSGE